MRSNGNTGIVALDRLTGWLADWLPPVSWGIHHWAAQGHPPE